MKKLRWTMDGQGFWDLDVSTPTTLDGSASPVPGSGHLLPLGLSRGIRLSRPKQIDFMQRFMAAPFIPSYASSHGFSLQRVFSIPFSDFGFASFLGQFNVQKFVSSFKRAGETHQSASSLLQSIGRHLRQQSLYAFGISTDISLAPDDALMISLEACGDADTLRTKAVLHHEFLHHDVKVEAVSPGLSVDQAGNYWDVPFSLAIDLASAASDSGLSYHLTMHHNTGSPSQSGSKQTKAVPTSLLPGFSVKGAFSFKKKFDIWRSKAKKLKMVQPYDIFLSNPHVSVTGIIGAVAATFIGDSSVRSAARDFQEFKGFHMQTSKIRSSILADAFSSISLSAQYGTFQRPFLDLTRFCASFDFPSGSKFISGAMLLMEDVSNSRQLRTESIKAISPSARFSLQQQIAGPVSFRVDSGIGIDLKKSDGVKGIQVEDPTFALEYALQVLGSAKAIAWYSPKQREFMVELRFFEI